MAPSQHDSKIVYRDVKQQKKAWFVSDLVRNSEDVFSHDASQFVLLISQIPE